MPAPSTHRSVTKRIAIVVAGLVAFTLVWVIAVRLAVENIFRGIETQRATSLAAIDPFSAYSADADKATLGSAWISKSASLHMHTMNFDQAVEVLQRIVWTHHSYLEDLRTESRSGYGRSLSANVSVPSSDFEATLADLKTLGRADAISQAGEDVAVKLATAKRRLTSAQNNLFRLQRLQRDRKGELRDAVALEKDISQASEAAAEAEGQHDDLISTVAQAHIKINPTEDYRASMETNWAGTYLRLRNSLFEGVGTVLSSLSLFLGASFEYGLPLLVWIGLVLVPARAVWRRFRRPSPAVVGAR